MVSRLIIFAQIVTLWLFMNHFLADARKARSKHSVKTIEMENGDIYDCVDFYKQPAFNHPLLKNHSFYPEMRPSYRPKRERLNSLTPKDNAEPMDIKFKHGRHCPKGTVPIMRMNSNHDLLQAKLLRQHYTKLGVNSSGDQIQDDNSNVYFAIVQSKSDPAKAYYGVAATMSVYNPNVLPSQYSSGEIIIKGGNDAIIVGWTVNPITYKDNQTRFFIYTIAGESHCFNNECGFITVRSDIPYGFPMRPISQVGGPTYVNEFFVYQDARNGNWWLEVGADATILGFWPQKFFSGLYHSGSYVACGGEASGPSNLGLPEMGTGYYPFSDLKKYNAYCQSIQVVNEAQEVVYADDLERFCTDDSHYGVFQLEHRVVPFGGTKAWE